METIKDITTPIGRMRICASLAGLRSVTLLRMNQESTNSVPDFLSILEEAETQLLGYFSGKAKQFDLPLDWSGMPEFRRIALQKAFHIPWGEVITYAELARLAGSPQGARAAGGALAHNPFLIVVPCHRVVASDGSLHGFSAEGGIKTKQQLLEFEGHGVLNGKVIFTK